MTTLKNTEIAPGTTAGEMENPGQHLPDTGLERLTGGAGNGEEWPPCIGEDELDADETAILEAHRGLEPGSDLQAR